LQYERRDVTFFFLEYLGRLAQPAEQLTLNQRVAGSNPASPIGNNSMVIGRAR
jgi:hypothetical protein